MTRRILVYEFISAGGPGVAVPDACDGTSLLTQGAAMRDALLADLLAIDAFAVSVADAGLAPLARQTARPGRAPALLVPDRCIAPAEWLRRVAPDFDAVWVIAPETADILADLSAAVGTERWIGCSPDAIRLTSSKTATRERLAAHGIPTPVAWAPGRPLPAHGGRWVIKPDDGAGTEHTRIFARFDDARAALDAAPEADRGVTLEGWVEGEPLSLSLLCAGRACELVSVNRQHVAPCADGRVVFAGVSAAVEPPSAALATLAERIRAAVPGLRGFVGVDLVRSPDGGVCVIEINPRLTCAYVGLSPQLGRNLAAEVLEAHAPTQPEDGAHTAVSASIDTIPAC